MSRRRITILSVVAGLVLIALVVWFVSGVSWLWSESRVLRSLGRQCLSLRSRLGTLGPSSLVDATDAAILASKGREADSTLDLVEAAVARLPQGQRNEFLRAMELRFLNPPRSNPLTHAMNVARLWGKKFPFDVVKEAFSSTNVGARAGADYLILDFGYGISREELGELVETAYVKGLTSDDTDLLVHALSTACYLDVVQFVANNRESIGELTRSSDTQLQILAHRCLQMLGAATLPTTNSVDSESGPDQRTSTTESAPNW